MVYRLDDIGRASPLFGDWQSGMLNACLEGVMGAVYADNIAEPKSAMARLGDFFCLAGLPDDELLDCWPAGAGSFAIMVPLSDGWADMVSSHYGIKAKPITRYAMGSPIYICESLQAAVDSIGPEYRLAMIDRDVYRMCQAEEWSRDLVSQYESYEKYAELGLGAAVIKDGLLVAGASSYATCSDGIELQVDTREGYRRRGLAHACAAKLILACLGRGMAVHWDAHNLESRALAEKLGYVLKKEYPAFEVVG